MKGKNKVKEKLLTDKTKSFKWSWLVFILGIAACLIVALIGGKGLRYASTDKYCQSCHVHTLADDTWKKSVHSFNNSGVTVHCVECHLPPKDHISYLFVKGKTGIKDLYSFYLKDHKSFDWESKRLLENAGKFVYNESCTKCHQNLYTKGLTAEGGTAHLYYEKHGAELNLQCINCHLDAGHYNANYKHGKMTGMPEVKTNNKDIFKEPTKITAFGNFTEKIPNTSVSFKMIAVKGGSFKMGSPDKEPFHQKDEGPVRNVAISPFFMGEVEVSWNEYWTFFTATMAEGRLDPSKVIEENAKKTDAISGPTPPFGIPDQGWGKGERPAITMTHYAAQIYCQWLSKVTGKHYRLPTEAEWEYACRAGSESPYFFAGNPKKFSEKGFSSRIFGVDTVQINRYVVYSQNSKNKTQEPGFVKANPFGLKNMLGNVMEFCSDKYSETAYSETGKDVKDPQGPETGAEYVVRGGDYLSDAESLRCATRNHTKTYDWLKTDPQQPKSIWWYSDIKGIGFRVVCEPDSSLTGR